MLRDKVRKTDTLIALSELYESIQGEGLLVGLPSIFIRYQGCNLRCPWCDQPESLQRKEGGVPLGEVLRKVRSFSARHVVITGGEPFFHESLPALVRTLLEEGYSLQIETNGTLWIGEMEEYAGRVYVSCSPKAVADFFVHPRILRYAKELKFVVDSFLEEEHLLREEFVRFLKEGRVVLQPEGNRREFLKKALKLQRSLLLKGYEVRVIPQVHKLLGLR